MDTPYTAESVVQEAVGTAPRSAGEVLGAQHRITTKRRFADSVTPTRWSEMRHAHLRQGD